MLVKYAELHGCELSPLTSAHCQQSYATLYRRGAARKIPHILSASSFNFQVWSTLRREDAFLDRCHAGRVGVVTLWGVCGLVRRGIRGHDTENHPASLTSHGRLRNIQKSNAGLLLRPGESVGQSHASPFRLHMKKGSITICERLGSTAQRRRSIGSRGSEP